MSDIDQNTSMISDLQITTEAINASVWQTKTDVNNTIDSINDDVTELTKSVNSKMTAEDVQLQISSALDNGVTSVTTTTGFTFNENGMTVSRTGSEMSTIITEDGMAVSRNDTEVLVCDNTGVIARNLNAETYLVVGLYSRLENYGEGRTGCFWVGGN